MADLPLCDIEKMLKDVIQRVKNIEESQPKKFYSPGIGTFTEEKPTPDARPLPAPKDQPQPDDARERLARWIFGQHRRFKREHDVRGGPTFGEMKAALDVLDTMAKDLTEKCFLKLDDAGQVVFVWPGVLKNAQITPQLDGSVVCGYEDQHGLQSDVLDEYTAKVENMIRAVIATGEAKTESSPVTVNNVTPRIDHRKRLLSELRTLWTGQKEEYETYSSASRVLDNLPDDFLQNCRIDLRPDKYEIQFVWSRNGGPYCKLFCLSNSSKIAFGAPDSTLFANLYDGLKPHMIEQIRGGK